MQEKMVFFCSSKHAMFWLPVVWRQSKITKWVVISATFEYSPGFLSNCLFPTCHASLMTKMSPSQYDASSNYFSLHWTSAWSLNQLLLPQSGFLVLEITDFHIKIQVHWGYDCSLNRDIPLNMWVAVFQRVKWRLLMTWYPQTFSALYYKLHSRIRNSSFASYIIQFQL